MMRYDSFDDMNLKEDLLRGIYKYGYKKPSEIQQSGIIHFSEGVNLVMQRMFGPGRTSTYCIGVLQRLDIDLHKCQCLILAFGGGQVREIAEAILKLGQFLGVKVHACLGIIDDISIDSHVVVGSADRVLTLLETILCPEEIKMVVLDEANTLLLFDSRKDRVYKIMEYLKLKVRNPLQIGAFSEKMPPETLEGITNKMEHEQLVIYGHELSLDGIYKHKFVNVEKEDLKQKELEKIINRTQEMQHIAPTMVFVSYPTKLVSLINELKNNGYKIFVTGSCMDQKERDEITEDFLHSTGVILTTSFQSRGIIEACGDEVRFIVNYDICLDVEEYIRQLGWFRRVDAAITFATSDDWDNLVWLQQKYKIVFERLQPSQNWAEFRKEEKVSAIKEAPIKHFILDVEDEEEKFNVLLDCKGVFYDEYDIARTSVIFVNRSEQILWLADKLKKLGSKYSIHTSKDSLLHDVDTRSRIFITTDEEPDDTVKVHFVINFNVPLARDNYYRRLAWCKSNGIFVLLGSEVDWSEALDMQALYGVFITWVPRYVADILQEMVLTETSPSPSKKPRTRGQLKN